MTRPDPIGLAVFAAIMVIAYFISPKLFQRGKKYTSKKIYSLEKRLEDPKWILRPSYVWGPGNMPYWELQGKYKGRVLRCSYGSLREIFVTYFPHAGTGNDPPYIFRGITNGNPALYLDEITISHLLTEENLTDDEALAILSKLDKQAEEAEKNSLIKPH